MAKTKLQMQDISDVLAAAIEPFQAPPLVAAPFTNITDLSDSPRKLSDPSKVIKPLLGVERITINRIDLSTQEKGPSGQQVWKTNDERVRFVGNFRLISSNTSAAYAQGQSIDDYLEITFYGTGLNILTIIGGTSTDYRVSIDGGAEGANIYPTGSAVLDARNYVSNSILNVASNLTLGIHTVRVRRAVSTGYFLNISGVEIITQGAQMRVPPGKIFNNGKGLTVNTIQNFNYDSSFSVGTPNGRGGRVVVYSEGNELKKAIQPADITAAYLSSTNHSNEEIVNRLNFREFGANRADDFSTIGASSTSRVFTLDDGTTTLGGNSVSLVGGAANLLGIGAAAVGAFLTITFVGTGLDVLSIDSSGLVDATQVFVDGTNVGSLTSVASGVPVIRKIVSGLPYGTHTVRFAPTTYTGTGTIAFLDFIVHAPKKPTVPEGTVEVGEYYLMADFVRNTFTTNVLGSMSTGVLRKAVTYREGVYVGTWTIGSINFGYDNGASIFSTTSGGTATYTFFGTGFDLRLIATNTTGALNVSLNGTSLNSSYPGASSITIQTYGGPNFGSMGAGATALLSTAANNTLVTTATPNNLNAGFVVRNLPLGLYTVTFTKNSVSTTEISSFDVITPTHFPNCRVGSLSTGPEVEIKLKEEKSNLDLSKAKAWLVFDGVNQLILASSNIAAVLRVNTGEFLVYFEKPFKTSNFVAVTSATKQAGNAPANTQFAEITGTTGTFGVNRVRVTAVNGTATYNPERFSLLCFGELEGEGN